MINTPSNSVLITGSGRGIGKAIALFLSGQGYSVVLHGRSRSEHLVNTRKQIEDQGGQAREIVFDVTDREQTKAVLETDIAAQGMYYGIVLNAGISQDNAFPFMSDDDWDNVLAANLDSFYNVLKPLVAPLVLAKKGGRIIVMTSISGLIGNRGQVNYSASKAGLVGAAKALGSELARKKITVNCIAPGLIETDMSESAEIKHILPLIPMRRIGQAEDVCGAVSFLMSDHAAYITRQTIAIDGGLT